MVEILLSARAMDRPGDRKGDDMASGLSHSLTSTTQSFSGCIVEKTCVGRGEAVQRRTL